MSDTPELRIDYSIAQPDTLYLILGDLVNTVSALNDLAEIETPFEYGIPKEVLIAELIRMEDFINEHNKLVLKAIGG